VIEILIVAAGAATAAGWGGLARWTTRRRDDVVADALTARAVGAGRYGLGEVVQGEVIAESYATPPAGGRACHGRLLLHEDGRTECHGGLDTCWGAGPHRGAPEACASRSHGCGVCQSTGRAS
jgi:hypothetical protein